MGDDDVKLAGPEPVRGSWWVGLSRAAFYRQQGHEELRMRGLSNEWMYLKGPTRRERERED